MQVSLKTSGKISATAMSDGQKKNAIDLAGYDARTKKPHRVF
ncbi:hypothetical protein Psta_2575 [Pirellula staleyi DSM 6068]|uniref:Uncharacterized protein n=1 Tax=Pirellula staleyi (strain ATCC 27377 / DSM 6068 / ICPB 4128) TaxID=530564 RepID=D2R5R2_PIRSD|nr:hypothetical protein Psta_2575 [Pirellula staleyi DSM 6068]